MCNSDPINGRDFSSEYKFSFSRSSGPGGQHLNKVSTRVELRFNVRESALLTPAEKDTVMEKLKSKLNTEGELIVSAQSERTQWKNREKAIQKFYALLSDALTPVKKRKPTRPSRASKEKRLEDKKIQAAKKKYRKGDDIQTDE